MAKSKIYVQLNGERYCNITVYNNQKVVHINKINKNGKMYDLAANKQAIKNLTANAYVLYSHLLHNKSDWLEAISKKRICEITSLGDRTYDKALDELIEKRYIVKKDHNEYENYYEFYEYPIDD